MTWLWEALAAVLKALLGYAGERQDTATATATTRDDAVQQAAAETATDTAEIADARSQVRTASDPAGVAAELRQRAQARRSGGGGAG